MIYLYDVYSLYQFVFNAYLIKGGFVYRSLQAGRAVAAIMVVLFHLGSVIALDKYFGYSAFSIPFSFGDSGVEFFFVLSGFIIYAAHRSDISKPHKFNAYIKKRLIRIYPTYWIIFLPIFFIALVIPSLSGTVPHDWMIIIKSLLLVPQDKSIVGGTGAPVIIVAWTLQYEMFFYLLFAFLILNRWLFFVILGMISFIYFYNFFTKFDSFPLDFLSKNYILLFSFGVIVSIIHNSKKLDKNHAIICLSIGLVFFTSISVDKVLQVNFFETWRVVLYGLASSLIVLGLVQLEDNDYVIGGQNSIQLLGNSSYALYLIHFPLISLLCKLCLFIQLDNLGVVGAIVAFIVIFCSCLIASVVFHLWIEKPVGAYLKRHWF